MSANPTNVANLITALSHRLFTLLPSYTFPGTEEGGNTDVLNCVRVLGRLLVVIYEAEDRTWADEHLWSKQKRPVGLPKHEEEVGNTTETQFTLADDSDEEEDGEDVELVEEGARAFKASVGQPRKVSVSKSPTKAASETNEDGTMRDPLANPGPEATEGVSNGEEEELMPSLAERLFSCTVDLLFCAGFTVPESVRGDGTGDKINVSIRALIG